MILRMICFNGMSYNMIDSGATFGDLSRVVARLEKDGYECTHLSPREVEVNSDGLINDQMGYLKLMAEKKR